MVSLLLLPADVALIIEVAEEDDEGHAVAEDHGVHGVWEVAVGEQVVAGVQEEEQELQLQGCMGTGSSDSPGVCMHTDRAEVGRLTSCREVRYRFHHRYFCMWGPMAAKP